MKIPLIERLRTNRLLTAALLLGFIIFIAACGDSEGDTTDHDNDDELNECGGEESLTFDGETAEPDQVCGECDDGVLSCDGEDELECLGATVPGEDGCKDGENTNPGNDTAKLDLLWMIDNSSSMCHSQQVMRDGIADLMEQLSEENGDFHLGVTTTHGLDRELIEAGDSHYYQSQLEPVARPGHLQSTPQPLPGFNQTCHHSLYSADHPDVTADPDSAPFPGDPNPNNLDPIAANIEVAIECTTNPENYAYLTNFEAGMMWESEADWGEALRCALEGINGECPNSLEDFFPDPADYRDLPVTLRSSDYLDDNEEFDIERMARDFTCMSLVGTRGHGIERGLDAVVAAVSPELTGGPDGNPADYPNAGFLREDAATGVIFVSDENDCSHGGSFTGEDGTFIEEAICAGTQKCAIAEANGDLAAIESLAQQFMENLSESRGVDIDAGSVFPASFHATYDKLDADDVPETCSEGWSTNPSCLSDLGTGWSGHRYEEFLRQFDTFFPEPDSDSPELPLDGLICDSNGISQGMSNLGSFFGND